MIGTCVTLNTNRNLFLIAKFLYNNNNYLFPTYPSRTKGPSKNFFRGLCSGDWSVPTFLLSCLCSSNRRIFDFVLWFLHCMSNSPSFPSSLFCGNFILIYSVPQLRIRFACGYQILHILYRHLLIKVYSILLKLVVTFHVRTLTAEFKHVEETYFSFSGNVGWPNLVKSAQSLTSSCVTNSLVDQAYPGGSCAEGAPAPCSKLLFIICILTLSQHN